MFICVNVFLHLLYLLIYTHSLHKSYLCWPFVSPGCALHCKSRAPWLWTGRPTTQTPAGLPSAYSAEAKHLNLLWGAGILTECLSTFGLAYSEAFLGIPEDFEVGAFVTQGLDSVDFQRAFVLRALLLGIRVSRFRKPHLNSTRASFVAFESVVSLVGLAT